MSYDSKIINAAVVLFSGTGSTILDKSATANNLKSLAPSDTAIIQAASLLKKKGFIVNAAGPTLSVAGKKILFEKVFGFTVEMKKSNTELYPVAKTNPVIPPDLKPHVKTIVFSEPMEYFV